MVFISVNLQGAFMAGDRRHAQDIMKDLGLTYLHSVPQTISDSWHFWGVSGYVEELPNYVQVSNQDPQKYVGLGLSEKTAAYLLSEERSNG